MKKPAKSSTLKGKTAKVIPVDAIKHKDARVNIPTEELRDFVRDEEERPTTLLYPRDPSLDPQLVWKGKDEQDRQDLAVPVVPIYIQEKIHPQALVENLRDTAAAGQPEPELSLFADFNGIEDFDKKVDFYHHEGHWSNRMILGDSLLVMASLAEKEGLKGKVQCIYFDPPYGIKFGSNWQVSTRKREVNDGKGSDATRQPEQIRAFRDTWVLGIHSYLSYLRDRLEVARELLTGSGSVFVQIGDANVHMVRALLDEVFGSENSCGIISFAKTTGQTNVLLSSVSDFLVWYAKDIGQVKFRHLYAEKLLGGAGGAEYSRVLLGSGADRPASRLELDDPSTLPPGARLFRLDNLTSQSQGREKGEGAASWFPVNVAGKEYRPSLQARWKTNEQGMRRLMAAGRVTARATSLGYVRFLEDFSYFALTSSWTDTAIAGRPGDKLYVVQTSPKVVERCVLMTSDPGDLVLDPTCGSGTTAYVSEQWGRR